MESLGDLDSQAGISKSHSRTGSQLQLSSSPVVGIVGAQLSPLPRRVIHIAASSNATATLCWAHGPAVVLITKELTTVPAQVVPGP